MADGFGLVTFNSPGLAGDTARARFCVWSADFIGLGGGGVGRSLEDV